MKGRLYLNTDEWKYGQFLREKSEMHEFEIKEIIRVDVKILL